MNLTKQILAFTKDPHKWAFMLVSSLFLPPDKKEASASKRVDTADAVRESYTALLAQARRDYSKDVQEKLAEYKKYLESLLQEARLSQIKKKGQ